MFVLNRNLHKRNLGNKVGLGLLVLLFLSACGHKEGLQLSDTLVESTVTAEKYVQALKNQEVRETALIRSIQVNYTTLTQTLAKSECEILKAKVSEVYIEIIAGIDADYDKALTTLETMFENAYGPLWEMVKVEEQIAINNFRQSQQLPQDQDLIEKYLRSDARYLAIYVAVGDSNFNHYSEAQKKVWQTVRAHKEALKKIYQSQLPAIDCAEKAKNITPAFTIPETLSDEYIQTLLDYNEALELAGKAFQNYFSSGMFGHKNSYMTLALEGLKNSLLGGVLPADGSTGNLLSQLKNASSGLSAMFTKAISSDPKIEAALKSVLNLEQFDLDKVLQQFFNSIPKDLEKIENDLLKNEKDNLKLTQGE